MNRLIIDIRDTTLRAVYSNDGVLEYCRTFDFQPMAPQTEDNATIVMEPLRRPKPAANNPYLIYYDTEEVNPWDLSLKGIVKQIRADIKGTIDSAHLIIPSEDVITATHQLPKMARLDAQQLIGRKITMETREEFPPFTIIPAASDQKTQSWFSLYIPTTTLRDYRKSFASCGLRLASITTPVNAMIDAFRSVREAIFNSHAIFEIQRGYVEAFYISADGILHFERLPYLASATIQENNLEEAEKAQKQKIFKIINSIFSVNFHYQTDHPTTPVQMAWLCGLESGLDEVATALKDAMGIEVGIAPAMPSGLPDETGYVPLTGFATALQNNSATTYSPADFFRRFPLRKTSGIMIYTFTLCAALLAVTLTEREYRALLKQVKQQQGAQPSKDQKQGSGKSASQSAQNNNFEVLKKLTSRQLTFYEMFRNLATDLPEGIYLENVAYQIKDDRESIDITALARLDDKISEQLLLSKFMTMLERSATLKKHSEPAIAVVAKDKDRFLKITFSSEVNARDPKK